MVEEIQTDASPSVVGAKRTSESTADSEAEAPQKKKRTSPDMRDLMLELPGGMTVRGTTVPTLWKCLSTEETMEAAELRDMSMQAPIRYSLQLSRRFLTPVMGLRRLYRLFQFINYDFKVQGQRRVSGPHPPTGLEGAHARAGQGYVHRVV